VKTLLTPEHESQKNSVFLFLLNWSTPLALIIIYIFFSFMNPYFATPSTLLDMLNRTVVLGIMSLAFTMAFITGGIDVSIGASCSLGGVMACIMFQQGYSSGVAIGVALLTGLVIGLINAFLCGIIRILPMLATLSTMFIFQGVELAITKAQGLYPRISDSYLFLGRGSIGPIPVSILILLVLGLIARYFLYSTRLGRHFYATGGSKEAAKAAGIDIYKVIMLAFIFSGMLASFSGVMLSSRLASAQTQAGSGYLLYALTATFLGTTMFGRGEPNVEGTILGALFIMVVDTGLTMMNVWWYWQYVVTGIILILAIVVKSLRRMYIF
jgi:ribose/xylose/arabinose/galactoside ABC-type transport system permease subunit